MWVIGVKHSQDLLVIRAKQFWIKTINQDSYWQDQPTNQVPWPWPFIYLSDNDEWVQHIKNVEKYAIEKYNMKVKSRFNAITKQLNYVKVY